MENNKLITNLAIKFIEEHWDEIINKDAKQINYKEVTKDEMLETISNDYEIAGWIISEVMNWGCHKNYLRNYIVEGDSDRHVIKIEDTYFIMSDDYAYVEVKPKFKTVIYFE